MEDSTSLTSLMIVVAIAFLIPILIHQLRLKALPVVVAEILAGLIIGKSGFNIVAEDNWLELLSMFGLIFLMFLSGLEIDFTQFRTKSSGKKKAANPFVISSLIFIAIMVVSYGLALGIMGLGFVSEPYLMTILIATISLGVVVPVLKEQKLIETPLGQSILLVTVIADFITMILLAVYTSSLSGSMGSMILLLVFFMVVVGVYFFIRRFSRKKFFDVLRKGSSQFITRGIFALIFLFVFLSEYMGVENILGAFLAGVIVSLLAQQDKSLQHSLESFGYGFLIPIFFVMVGVKLNIWELLSDWKILLFIPVLLLAIFISKMLPAIILRGWFSWSETWGAGFLLSATLSLMIAAATVTYELGIIDKLLHDALIVVAIITCLIAPILFNRIMPNYEKKPFKVSMIGANHMTLPVTQDLVKEGWNVNLYSAKSNGADTKIEQYSRFPLIEVARLDVVSLADKGAFDSDVIVAGSMNDADNMQIARHARQLGIERVIVRIEEPDRLDQAQEEGFTVISSLYSSRVLLKGLIEYPSAVRLITQNDDSIQEVVVGNTKYENMLLRELPFLGNTLIMRIYRGESFVIPHGTSEIHMGDRLLVSGAAEHIHEMKRELE